MTKNNLNHYDKLAVLFRYPGADFPEEVKNIEKFLEQTYPETIPVFSEFANYVYSSTRETLEEIYTRTFDVQAITTLDLGYVLFGDDYKRGALLANLSKEHQNANNDCGKELADNLSNLLTLLPKLTDAELQNELVGEIILPALFKIIEEFKTETVNLKNKIYKKQHKTIIEQSDNYRRIYRAPLAALYEILKKDFGFNDPVNNEIENSFTKSITTEIKID